MQAKEIKPFGEMRQSRPTCVFLPCLRIALGSVTSHPQAFFAGGGRMLMPERFRLKPPQQPPAASFVAGIGIVCVTTITIMCVFSPRPLRRAGARGRLFVCHRLLDGFL